MHWKTPLSIKQIDTHSAGIGIAVGVNGVGFKVVELLFSAYRCNEPVHGIGLSWEVPELHFVNQRLFIPVQADDLDISHLLFTPGQCIGSEAYA